MQPLVDSPAGCSHVEELRPLCMSGGASRRAAARGIAARLAAPGGAGDGRGRASLGVARLQPGGRAHLGRQLARRRAPERLGARVAAEDARQRRARGGDARLAPGERRLDNAALEQELVGQR